MDPQLRVSQQQGWLSIDADPIFESERPGEHSGIKTLGLVQWIFKAIITFGRGVKTIEVGGKHYRVDAKSFDAWKARLRFRQGSDGDIPVNQIVARMALKPADRNIGAWYRNVVAAASSRKQLEGMDVREPAPTAAIPKGAKKIEPDALVSTLGAEFGLSPDRIAAAAARFSIVKGSITDQPTGVIQDPAGSAVGASRLQGGGLSGAIYRKFAGLNPIPHIAPGKSVFNSGATPGARRILHTHSPHLSKVRDLKQAVDVLSDAYLDAIREFVAHADERGEDTLNLCALSAAIYGASFAVNWPGMSGGHIDPSITESALVIALAKYADEDPQGIEGKQFKLFYYVEEGSAFGRAADQVKQALEG